MQIIKLPLKLQREIESLSNSELELMLKKLDVGVMNSPASRDCLVMAIKVMPESEIRMALVDINKNMKKDARMKLVGKISS